MQMPFDPFDADSPMSPTTLIHVANGLFSIETEVTTPSVMYLMTGTGGPRPLWTRHFGDLTDRDAVLKRFQAGSLDLTFLGRVTMIFGPTAITAAVDRVVTSERKIRNEQAEAEAKRQRDRDVINLYAPDSQRGYKLELQRKSDGDAEWSVRYDRASERDRLCDWLRWQKSRFDEFLEYAAKHGSEALTRMFVDEMFETERRVKKQGRGAGGLRPLRMWRGD